MSRIRSNSNWPASENSFKTFFLQLFQLFCMAEGILLGDSYTCKSEGSNISPGSHMVLKSSNTTEGLSNCAKWYLSGISLSWVVFHEVGSSTITLRVHDSEFENSDLELAFDWTFKGFQVLNRGRGTQELPSIGIGWFSSWVYKDFWEFELRVHCQSLETVHSFSRSFIFISWKSWHSQVQRHHSDTSLSIASGRGGVAMHFNAFCFSVFHDHMINFLIESNYIQND